VLENPEAATAADLSLLQEKLRQNNFRRLLAARQIDVAHLEALAG